MDAFVRRLQGGLSMSEQRLIDANALLEKLKEIPVYVYKDFENLVHEVMKAPTIDPLRHGYVLSSVHEQVQWERDIAIDQLHSYGVEFGEKADVQRVRHGKWVDGMKCSECGQVDTTKPNYCPNCGAKMDGE